MNLGHFETPLLLFGGAYSNLDALTALKQKAGQLGISPDHVICTGDIVAYCGQPYETVETIRDWGIHVLMGNCEASFANEADDCGCGFGEGTSCDLLSVEWFQFANRQLTTDQRTWFLKLPTAITFTIGNKKARIVHGSSTSINQFIFSSTDTVEFEKQFNHSQADIIISGHSGIPFVNKIDNKIWHNAGAIGMPANDGCTHTWYSILSAENNSMSIKISPLDYDYLNAKNKMITAGLNNSYTNALETGLWPSMDILPKTEQQKQGQALIPEIFYF